MILPNYRNDRKIVIMDKNKLPEHLLNQIHRLINLLKRGKLAKGKIRSFKLKEQFDNVNIRKKAYE